MERLVEWNCKEKNSALPKCINEWGDVVPLEDICAQLATIYDILGDCDLDRLRELVEADKAERAIIAPVQIGDNVWHITTCKDFAKVLDGTMYGANGELGTATGYYCPCELVENCPFQLEEDGSFDCDKHKNTLAIYEDVVTEIVVNDIESYAQLEYSGCVDFDDFGKNVFLTREAAEDALRKGGNR